MPEDASLASSDLNPAISPATSSPPIEENVATPENPATETNPSAPTTLPENASQTDQLVTFSVPAPVTTSSANDIRALLPLARAKRAAYKTQRLEKIVHYLTTHKSISNDQVQMLLRVSDKTATNYLHELTVAGKIKREGAGSSIRYIRS